MDSSTLASATVSISGNFRSGEDPLSFTNDGGTMGNIRSSYAADTGILTLISPGATATLSEWSHALRAVSYSNASEAPAGGTRTLSLVVNDGITSSSPASTAIEIAAVNDAPVLSIARPGGRKGNHRIQRAAERDRVCQRERCAGAVDTARMAFLGWQ